MKVIFIGTPQIAADYLKLLFTNIEISLVITQKPKARGRGLKVSETPVSKVAQDLQLEVLEVDDINHWEVVEKIKNSG
ncbi:MAG: methionyl-tRNA formyltransferase, partial [Candidatus Nanopelagicales bacterium]